MPACPSRAPPERGQHAQGCTHAQRRQPKETGKREGQDERRSGDLFETILEGVFGAVDDLEALLGKERHVGGVHQHRVRVEPHG
eukprot:3238920-Rhodomonas_salina.1